MVGEPTAAPVALRFTQGGIVLSSGANAVPGMVQPIEQRLLYSGARCLHLAPGESMVEFGTFFGRSTLSIAQGLRDNERGDASNVLYVYDSFECDLRGGLAPYVHEFAREGQVEALLDVCDGRLGFRRVFEHYLAEHLACGRVRVSACELTAAEPPASRIAFMHIDAPKWYREFRPILYRFFPQLRVGSIVIFQDYFYQWSASLIAAVQLLVESGVARMCGSVISSLAIEITAAPTVDRIRRLDLTMQQSDLGAIIDRAIVACGGIEVARRERFIPRLHLAKLQHLWERGQYGSATLELRTLLEDGSMADSGVRDDLFELMQHGFSLRASYELDHSSGADLGHAFHGLLSDSVSR